MGLLPCAYSRRDVIALATLALLIALAAGGCTLVDDGDDSDGGGAKLNPLEAAAEELLPPDATVLERADSVCTYGVPQPSCEFVRYVLKGVPQALRVEDARNRIAELEWTIVRETHFDKPGQAGGVLFEIARDERFARWWVVTDADNARCFDGTLKVLFCADSISMY